MLGCPYCGEPHTLEECPHRKAREQELKKADEEDHLTRDTTQMRVDSRDRSSIHNLQ